MQTALSWSNPEGTTQLRVQLVPYRDDGPGIDLYLGVPASTLHVPAPPQWYGLLPDMTYTWRVQTSSSPSPVSQTDGSWGPWAQRTLRTPKVQGGEILAISPVDRAAAASRTPTLQWSASEGLFYYEVQLSRDARFDTDPRTATTRVYEALLHGGLTSPRNSYAITLNALLEGNALYYWRVRPRVQGDGSPVAWSGPFTFTTGSSDPTVGPISFGTSVATHTGCQLGNQQDPPGPAVLQFGAATVYARFTYKGPGSVSLVWFRGDTAVLERRPLSLTGLEGCAATGFSSTDGAPLARGSYRLDIQIDDRVMQSRTLEIR